MTSSSGTSACPPSPTGDEPRQPLGHLHPREPLLAGVRVARRKPRLSERPEMYGNGCPGPTASGVSTG